MNSQLLPPKSSTKAWREREEAIDREKSIINAPIFLLQPPMHESDQFYLSIESYPTEMEVLGFATDKYIGLGHYFLKESVCNVYCSLQLL